MAEVDVLVAGGGINGCAIAREAALLGLSVMLVERDDLASHTSSASTKLIHGGLRYLELYDFRLVAEALHERERLLKAAPHLIRPLRFVLPQENAVRPWWLVRAGLLLYDLLAWGTSLPRSRGLQPTDAEFTAPLSTDPSGFVYADAYVDDARLVLANARDAAQNGAQIVTRTAVVAARRSADAWHVDLSDGRTCSARALVNAAGPWVTDLLGRSGIASSSRIRLVKGSHIVVPRLYHGDHAYILQQPDRRIVFALPYHGATAVGTTDVAVDRPEDAVIDDAEIAYLCDAINRHFIAKIAPDDVTSTWSGVRALYDDGAGAAQTVTRDYVLELDTAGAPCLSVFGGKITTGRRLAEDALAKLAPALGVVPHPVTRVRPFPGGAIEDMAAFRAKATAAFPFLTVEQVARMSDAYGLALFDMLDGVTDAAGLGDPLGAGLTPREVRWMRDREWATTPDDVLDRRSKLGLVIGDDPAVRLRIAAILAE